MLSRYPVALGTWVFGDQHYWKDQSHSDSIRTIKRALTSGIKHIDTAFSYGNGRSEQLIGQQLNRMKEHVDRKDLIIATKINTYEPSAVHRRIKESAARLQTDYIDIVYLHWPRTDVDILPIFKELHRLKDSGLIRYIGATNLPFALLEKVHGLVSIDIFQSAYSLLWRVPEKEIIPFCREEGIIFAAYSPLAQGLLAGRDFDSLSNEDMRKRLVFLSPDHIEETRNIVNTVRDVSFRYKKSMSQTAIDWISRTHKTDTIILGCRKESQLIELIDYHRKPLSDSDMNLLDSISKNTTTYTEDNIFGHTW